MISLISIIRGRWLSLMVVYKECEWGPERGSGGWGGGVRGREGWDWVICLGRWWVGNGERNGDSAIVF